MTFVSIPRGNLTALPMRQGIAWSAVSALVLALGVGFLQPFTVSIVGEMPLAEVLLLPAAALLLAVLLVRPALAATLPGYRLVAALVVAQGVALFGYAVADLYRVSSAHDLARGWARLIFLMIDTLTIAGLFSFSPWCFILLEIGRAAGMAISTKLFGALFNDFWKFGYALPVALLAVIMAPVFGYVAVELTLLALGVLNLWMDYRSLGIECFLAASLLLITRMPVRLRAWVLPLSVIGGVVVIALLYATTGAAKRRTTSDVERGAMLASVWEAFTDSPLIGQGSWFSKSAVIDNYFELRYQRARWAGAPLARTGTAEGWAVHSQLLVSLAEGGILGGTFFLLYGALLLWGILHIALRQQGNPQAALYLLVLIAAFYDLFMSPFSGVHRVSIAVAVAVISQLWQERQRMRWHGESARALMAGDR